MDEVRGDQVDASPLAVVGMAGRLPGSPDLDAFWTLLTGRGTAITTAPPSRRDPAAPPVRGGFIAWIDQFDPAFFGIPPETAADVDPRQRLMLEAAWQALEDAGVPAASVKGPRTGVYVGAGSDGYALLRKQTGATDRIAGRVAEFLGVTGPRLVVQSGGSSALTALHLAATALRAGELDAALVGGVNLIITPDARDRVRGEGVLACYVKTLAKAKVDGDRIRAVLTATSVGPAQPPPNLAHVERPEPLAAKIGDLEAASGLAGLAKAVLALENHVVPGANALGEGARVGVATDGAYAVLAAAPPTPPPALATGPAFVPLSAHTDDALRQRAADLATVDVAPAVLAGTLGRRRDHFAVRAGFVAADPAELAGLLGEFAADYEEVPIAGVVTGRAHPPGRVAFVFPGHGARWAGVGRELHAADPGFAAVLRRCGQALAPHVDWDLPKVVTGTADWTAEPAIATPVAWALAVGIAELWRSAGVEPDIVLGHGPGEIAAATVAGMLSYEDAALVVTRCGAVAGRYAGAGRMLAVGLDARKAMLAAEPFDGALALAADNGPHGCVLTGETEAVLALKQRLDAVGTDCALVGEPIAAHSKHVDVLTEDLLLALDPVHPRPAPGEHPVELMSTVQVRPVPGTELTARYWTENLRQPVLFADAVDTLLDRGVTHLIEISGRPTLTDAIERLAARRAEPPVVLTSLHEGHAGPRDVLAAFARAYVSGLEPVAAVPAGPPVAVPGYPWQRDTHWVSGGTDAGADPVLTPAPGEHDTWQAVLDLDQRDHPWLTDHVVHGDPVLPAAAVLTLVLAAARSRTGALPDTLDAIRFTEPLPVGEPVRLAFLWRDDVTGGGSVTLKSLPRGRSEWTEHASARVVPGDVPAPPEFPRYLTDIEPVTAAAFYACRRDGGTDYGPALQGVRELHTNGDYALGELVLPEQCAAGQRPHQLHPALLDAALQVSQALLDGDEAVLPVSATAVHRHGEPAEPVAAGWSYAIRQGDGLVDVHLYDADRKPLLSVLGLAVQALPADAGGPDERVHRLVFVEQPCEERLLAGAQPAGVWLVAGDDTTGIAAELVAAGVKVTQAATVVGEDLLREVVPTGLLFLAPTAADGLDRQRTALHELTLTARAAAALPIPPRLVVLTKGAQPVSDGDLPDPGAALYWGYGRVLRREHPELRSLVLDVDGTVSDAVTVEELVADEGEDQAALRGGRRYVARLIRGLPDEPPMPAWRGPAQPFRLAVDSPEWTGLAHKPLARRAPGKGEVEIRVTATGLTRRDTGFAEPFGAECAGVVTGIGAGVLAFEPGDRVIACVPGALASHVTVCAEHVKPIPESMDDADAAAIPLALVTAWHCLHELARLDADDTVLVHGAAGAVGLAAIAVATAAGATVLATAGTDDKRDHLRALGVEHVFDSRSLSWADDVRAATGGRGVDVVLNSLPGAAIRLGLDVLAEYGRFVELGGHDIGRGHTIGLAPFAKGISVAAADVVAMLDRRPARFARLLDEVWPRVADHEFAPPPLTRFTFAEAAEALRYLADDRHLGKIVLVDPASVRSVAPEPVRDGRFRADGTYLITGGLGALGRSLAEYLAEHGAGAIALADTAAPGEQALATIARLRAAGVPTHVLTVDVADRAALDAALGVLRAELPPLRGIVHAAGVTIEAPIDELTDQQTAAVLAPKIDGAANLHTLTPADPLDLFVTFSSAACLLGDPGHAATAAADAFLDALVAARRTCGLAGLSVQWGEFDGDQLEPAQAWPALTGFLARAEQVVGFVPLDLLRFFDTHPDTASQAGWQVLWRLTEALKAEVTRR